MSDSINVRKTVKIVLALIVFFFLWFVPAAILGLPELTVIQQRVIAVFGLALVLWFTEAIPSWTTSMMIVVIHVDDHPLGLVAGETEGVHHFQTLHDTGLLLVRTL